MSTIHSIITTLRRSCIKVTASYYDLYTATLISYAMTIALIQFLINDSESLTMRYQMDAIQNKYYICTMVGHVDGPLSNPMEHPLIRWGCSPIAPPPLSAAYVHYICEVSNGLLSLNHTNFNLYILSYPKYQSIIHCDCTKHLFGNIQYYKAITHTIVLYFY